jgi:hypothetical protein
MSKEKTHMNPRSLSGPSASGTIVNGSMVVAESKGKEIYRGHNLLGGVRNGVVYGSRGNKIAKIEHGFVFDMQGNNGTDVRKITSQVPGIKGDDEFKVAVYLLLVA